MGNVQCCANRRFPQGKLKNKLSDKKKSKKNKQKSAKTKTNGVGGDKGKPLTKVQTVAEDVTERAAPAADAATQQAVAPVAGDLADTPHQEAGEPQGTDNADSSKDTTDVALRPESVAAARERFFTQVHINEIKNIN